MFSTSSSPYDVQSSVVGRLYYECERIVVSFRLRNVRSYRFMYRFIDMFYCVHEKRYQWKRFLRSIYTPIYVCPFSIRFWSQFEPELCTNHRFSVHRGMRLISQTLHVPGWKNEHLNFVFGKESSADTVKNVSSKPSLCYSHFNRNNHRSLWPSPCIEEG